MAATAILNFNSSSKKHNVWLKMARKYISSGYQIDAASNFELKSPQNGFVA